MNNVCFVNVKSQSDVNPSVSDSIMFCTKFLHDKANYTLTNFYVSRQSAFDVYVRLLGYSVMVTRTGLVNCSVR